MTTPAPESLAGDLVRPQHRQPSGIVLKCARQPRRHTLLRRSIDTPVTNVVYLRHGTRSAQMGISAAHKANLIRVYAELAL